MSAQRALASPQPDVGEFHCPLSVDDSGRCHLFEAVVVQLAQTENGKLSKVRISCRFLAVRSADHSCLLGNAKTRRDHLA